MFDGKLEIEEIFSEAWQKVLAGHSIESAVSECPDYAAEIEPMLRLTAAMRSIPSPPLSAGVLARIKEHAQEAVQERDRIAAIAPGRVNYGPYIEYVQPRRSLKSWLASMWPPLPTLRGGVSVLLMLAILAGTMAIITNLSQQADSHEPLETYSGTITKMTTSAWWIGNQQILVDNTTRIYGEPRVGAEMVCIGRSLPGDRMKAMEVWIRLAPGWPTVLPTQSVSLPTGITDASASVIFLYRL